MSTTANKSEIDNLYKSAIENQNRSKLKTLNTVYTSTATEPSKSAPMQINFPLNDSVIAKDQASNLVGLLELDSDDSGDITIQPVDNSNNIISDKQLTKIKTSKMAQHNLFATLKYIVEVVPFFDGKNIPLNYFIKECKETKSMLSDEAESQFTKIIRTQIIA